MYAIRGGLGAYSRERSAMKRRLRVRYSPRIEHKRVEFKDYAPRLEGKRFRRSTLQLPSPLLVSYARIVRFTPCDGFRYAKPVFAAA